MNLRKFISGISALAIAASAFAGLAVTANAANDLALGISKDETTGVTTIAHNTSNDASTSVSNDDVSVSVTGVSTDRVYSTSFDIVGASSITITTQMVGAVTFSAKPADTDKSDTATITIKDSNNETVKTAIISKNNKNYSTFTFKSSENETYTVQKTAGAAVNIKSITFKNSWTNATIGEVQGGKWYTYDEATGTIINTAPTEANPVAAKPNYVIVTPGDDTVTSVTVTYTSQYVKDGTFNIAGATVDDNHASITKDGLNLSGSGSIRVGILVTTTNAFNGHSTSISGTNFNQDGYMPTITVE